MAKFCAEAATRGEAEIGEKTMIDAWQPAAEAAAAAQVAVFRVDLVVLHDRRQLV